VTDLRNQLGFLGIEHAEKMVTKVVPKAVARGQSIVDVDLLMWLLRPIMIRHSQGQTYRNTATTLMNLPPKVRAVADRVGS
jgi:hypothetical protein